MIEYFADIGSNYITDKGASLKRAYDLIDAAEQIGCAGVKFQYFDAEQLWHPSMKKELKAAKERELPFDWIPPLSFYARNRGLLFGLSVFDFYRVDAVKAYVDYFKIASFEISKFELIKKCYLTGKRLMLSTGQSDKHEISDILFNLPQNKAIPGPNIDILHCVSKYPAQPRDCNMSIIKSNPWINGWSDHTTEAGTLFAAVGVGVKIIEFHLDLEDYEGLETDHSWKPWPITFAKNIIKKIEVSMGTNDWDEVIKQQDRKYKANPETGLRGG